MYVECVQSIIPPRYFEHLSAVFHLCFVCVTQAGNDDIIGWVGQCVCVWWYVGGNDSCCASYTHFLCGVVECSQCV